MASWSVSNGLTEIIRDTAASPPQAPSCSPRTAPRLREHRARRTIATAEGLLGMLVALAVVELPEGRHRGGAQLLLQRRRPPRIAGFIRDDTPIRIPRATTPAEPAASSSSSVVQALQKEVSYARDSDTDSEFEMYDSDFDVEDGDDDLFSDNVDRTVGDHNEREVCVREMAFLSMLETIFYKILQRHEGKQREAKKCHEFEKDYCVDFKTKTCDCKRWQLTGIPCHHAIACCRKDRINPENLVHSCYTIDTFNKAYGFNLAPLRGRVFWEKMNAEPIHPPLYTKVMGRPKKSRKKSPEEKVKKGVTIITKAGTTIYYSVCGKAGHNKKGHNAYVNAQVEKMEEGIVGDDEEVDIPSILEHIIPHSPNPNLDPTKVEDSMVYKMQLEERDNVPVDRFLGPLPENAFVAAARESIPESRTRVTTASTRGRLRGRGRGTGGSNAPRPQARTNASAQQGSGSRGRAKSKKRSAEASTIGTTHVPDELPGARGRKSHRASNTGQNDIPDLNDDIFPDLNAQEFPLSQNAPPADDI
ncbi:hypothetical protein ACQ4PT_032739 [Festuca glaucescens]